MPARKPDSIRDQVIDLAKQGHGSRSIEAILAKRKVQIGKSAIAEIVRQYRAGAIPDPALKTIPAPTKAGPPVLRAPAPTTPPAEGGGEGGPVEVADHDLAELAKLATLFDVRLRGAVKVGDVRLAGWLLNARRTVAQEIAKLRPPILPDPAKDPANVLARDELRARLEAAVESFHKSDAGRAQLRAHLERVEAAARPPIAEAAE